MAKAKKKGNFIILVERVQTREIYFLGSVSYSKMTYKLIPVQEIDNARTYAAAETAQKDIDYLCRVDVGLSCAYGSHDYWRDFLKQRYDLDV